MKYYLSSFKLGNDPKKFLSLFSEGVTVGYIPNATDFTDSDPEKVKAHIDGDVKALEELGLIVKVVDLKKYFKKSIDELKRVVDSLSGLWVSGGNVFVLRQAMMLSGMDKIVLEKSKDPSFVYGGYSAGCCVLSNSLEPYQVASDASDKPYKEAPDTIWQGVGLIDYAFMPHFDSNHGESDEINKEIEFCKENGIRFTPVKDGDALIF